VYVGFRWNHSSWLWWSSPGDTASKEEWLILHNSGMNFGHVICSAADRWSLKDVS